tara:strand:+ start:1322 stop:1678 length:357 start_codon:yes stop_codon:yes gene_type:complete
VEIGYSSKLDTTISFSLLLPKLDSDSSVSILMFQRMDTLTNFNWKNTDPLFYMNKNKVVLRKRMVDSLVYNEGHVIVIDEFQFDNKIDKSEINNKNILKVFEGRELLENQFHLVIYKY